MRKKNAQPLAEVIQEYLKALGIDRRIKEQRIVKEWEAILGTLVSRATSKIYIYNKVLFVTLSSSVIRNELFMIKQSIIQALNERAGEELITDIVFK
jgi:predicted nucleic acid-binding Zn ribbon protein